MNPAPLPHQRLCAATQASHEQVDGVFGRYDLADRASYADFLAAHARVLPPIETTLAGIAGLPAFPPRASDLAADLAVLDRPMPVPIRIDPPGCPAEAWAMLYVVEGSRLGGVMLARSVPPDLPRAYLSAGHQRGGWRAILAGFDAAAEGEAWMERAERTARATFALYARSAETA